MEIKVNGQARYSHVLKPSSAKGVDVLKYSIQILINKSDSQCEEISAIVDKVIKEKFPKGAPSRFYNCWNDLGADESCNEELKDYMCLTLSSKTDSGRPVLCDKNLKPITEQDFIIDGKMVWVNGLVWAFDKGSNGVKTFLNGTCVLDTYGPIPLEFISSKPSVEDMFGDVVKPSNEPNF